MILRDDKGRSWKVQLNKKEEKHIYIGRGFRAFRVANGLKKGDEFKFELIENENDNPPIVNFSLLKSKPINTYRKAKLEQKERIPYEEDDLPYFMGKLKSCNIRRSHLYLPLKFARLNGLINKKQMILKNVEDGRTWSLEIQNHKKKFYYIGQGWKDFRVANGLKEGDCFKLQVVDKGEMPIANFYLFLRLPSSSSCQADFISTSGKLEVVIATKLETTSLFRNSLKHSSKIEGYFLVRYGVVFSGGGGKVVNRKGGSGYVGLGRWHPMVVVVGGDDGNGSRWQILVLIERGFDVLDLREKDKGVCVFMGE
ncbi:unnamed protein product [Lactuca saligna]|uniref:TF-B3 domain-containing protein n=1 Tax=Lactuca saligna TaxID=75948 RepID=A0AA35VVK9_LACSI|nr:unnamed protein product [Lactuca saligna]